METGEWNRVCLQVAEGLKAENPDFAAIPWSTGPGRGSMDVSPIAEGSEGAVRLPDAPILELFWDFPADHGSNLLPAFTIHTTVA